MKRQQIITALLIAVLLGSAIYKATRPDAGLLKFRVQGTTAYGYGTTDSRSYGVIKRLVRDHPQVETLVFKNMPGTKDVDTNLKIARNIRKAGLNTHLEGNSFIASGAVDLFLSGKTRTMECGAMIGVHTIHYYNEGALTKGKSFHPGNMGRDPFQKRNEAFLRDMGIDPAFYEFSRDKALPEDLYYLTPADINRFDLLGRTLTC